MICHSLSLVLVINELFFIHVLTILKAVMLIGFSKIHSQFKLFIAYML